MYVPPMKWLEKIDLPSGKIAIIATRFNVEIVDSLIKGALEALNEHGVLETDLQVHYVPGAFELPLACQVAVNNPDIVGIIALGAVIRGDTPHFDYVCKACTDGILQVQLSSLKPVMFGVLTTDTLEQALARAGGKMGNKGYETAYGLLAMMTTLTELSKEKSGITYV